MPAKRSVAGTDHLGCLGGHPALMIRDAKRNEPGVYDVKRTDRSRRPFGTVRVTDRGGRGLSGVCRVPDSDQRERSGTRHTEQTEQPDRCPTGGDQWEPSGGHLPGCGVAKQPTGCPTGGDQREPSGGHPAGCEAEGGAGGTSPRKTRGATYWGAGARAERP